jgi:hypothetical protein
MLKVTDSGCAKHPPQHFTLTGLEAALVDRLTLNLPPTKTGNTYICEHGHTHCLTIQPGQGTMTTGPAQFGLASSTVLNH